MKIELAAGAALLAAMLCVAWYGFVTLPTDARVPIHFGPAGYNRFASKRVGLLLHPAIGVVLFAVLAGLGQGSGANTKGGPEFVPIAMGVLLIVQAGSIWVARRGSSS